MYDWQDEHEVYAREMTAEYYLNKMLKTGWTATHTDKRITKWDITVTNGQTDIFLETKIRDINPEDYKDEGALIDAYKVDFLDSLGKSGIVQFFPDYNVAYCWPVSEKDMWKKEERYCRKDNFLKDKVKKEVYYMPMDEKHKRSVDMTDYNQIFDFYYNKHKEDN